MELSAPSISISKSPIFSSKGFIKTHVGSPNRLPTIAAITGASRQSYSPLKLVSMGNKFRAITAVSAHGGDGAGNGNSHRGNGGGDGTGGFNEDLRFFVRPEDRSVNFAAILALNGKSSVGSRDDGGDGANSLIVSAEVRGSCESIIDGLYYRSIQALLQFGGRKESLLADNSFFAMECGVGVLVKAICEKRKENLYKHLGTGPTDVAECEKLKENFYKRMGFVHADEAEYEKPKENFYKLPGIVHARMAMAANADFMCANLPVVVPANADDALQTALGGTSYPLLQRFGATVVGTIVVDTQMNAKRAVRNKHEDNFLSNGLRYGGFGLYMALVTNLEYQLLAGGVDPRRVEPFSRQQKLMLSADCDIQVFTESQSDSWIQRKITLRLMGAICLRRQFF